MFTFAQTREVTWPVTVAEAVDGGHVHHRQFNATFVLLDQDTQRQVMDEARADGQDDARALLRHVLADWDGIYDAAGQPIPFEDDMLERVIARQDIAVALLTAYNDALAGREAQRQGN